MTDDERLDEIRQEYGYPCPKELCPPDIEHINIHFLLLLIDRYRGEIDRLHRCEEALREIEDKHWCLCQCLCQTCQEVKSALEETGET